MGEPGRRPRDLVGERFGLLVVVNREASDKHYNSRWRCRCDCGNETVVFRNSLVTGGTKSCGCVRFAHRAARHGHARHRVKTPTYASWSSMRSRPANRDRICESWASFEAFLTDMGECPPGHRLERIDRSRGFRPDNCRWAPDQSRRQRTTV